MKKTWKAFCFLFLVFVCLFGFSSCSTTKSTIDLTDVVNPVLERRPDNTTLEVYAGPIYEDWQVMRNAATYLYAWEMWQAYADALEETIITIQEKLK